MRGAAAGICGLHDAALSAAKTLQETLQLCMEQYGKKGCKILARSLFSAIL
jgi:hypothetical protein